MTLPTLKEESDFVALHLSEDFFSNRHCGIFLFSVFDSAHISLWTPQMSFRSEFSVTFGEFLKMTFPTLKELEFCCSSFK